MANKLIILFDNTNAITSHIDPSIGVFRQGDVGHEIYCHFVNFANYAYGAYIIFERADGSKSPELPMTLADFTYSGTLYSGFKLVIDDEWIMAQDGSLKATVRVRNASGTVVASGLVPISLEKTVYDESPDITVEQYNALVAMLEGFITDDSILYPHVLSSVPEDLTDILVNSVLFVVKDSGDLEVYKVVASGEDKVLSDAFVIDSSLIKETFSPTNYTPTASTAKGHFVGIDNELDDIITGVQLVGKAKLDEGGNDIRASYGASLYTDDDDVALKIALRNKLNAVLTTLILREATTTKNGLLSSADKVKIDAITTDIATAVSDHNTSETAHDDIREEVAVKQPLADKNQINGYAGLDASAKIPTSLLPDSIVGQLEYQGVFDCSGGAYPAPAGLEKGYFYICSVSGTISGVAYVVGDWLVYNGSSWDKIDNTDAVASVNGKLGAVVLKGTDIKVSNADDVAIDTRILAMISDINNRYTKAQTYSTQEIEQRITDIIALHGLQDTAIEKSEGVFVFNNGDTLPVTTLAPYNWVLVRFFVTEGGLHDAYYSIIKPTEVTTGNRTLILVKRDANVASTRYAEVKRVDGNITFAIVDIGDTAYPAFACTAKVWGIKLSNTLAENVNYDKTVKNLLESDDVQGAIDELASFASIISFNRSVDNIIPLSKNDWAMQVPSGDASTIRMISNSIAVKDGSQLLLKCDSDIQLIVKQYNNGVFVSDAYEKASATSSAQTNGFHGNGSIFLLQTGITHIKLYFRFSDDRTFTLQDIVNFNMKLSYYEEIQDYQNNLIKLLQTNGNNGSLLLKEDFEVGTITGGAEASIVYRLRSKEIKSYEQGETLKFIFLNNSSGWEILLVYYNDTSFVSSTSYYGDTASIVLPSNANGYRFILKKTTNSLERVIVPSELSEAPILIVNSNYESKKDIDFLSMFDKNLVSFNPAELFQGGLIGGVPTAGNTRISTQLLSVKSGAQYKFISYSGRKCSIEMYDSSNTYLGSAYHMNSPQTLGFGESGSIYITKSNCTKIRIVIANNGDANISVSDLLSSPEFVVYYNDIEPLQQCEMLKTNKGNLLPMDISAYENGSILANGTENDNFGRLKLKSANAFSIEEGGKLKVSFLKETDFKLFFAYYDNEDSYLSQSSYVTSDAIISPNGDARKVRIVIANDTYSSAICPDMIFETPIIVEKYGGEQMLIDKTAGLDRAMFKEHIVVCTFNLGQFYDGTQKCPDDQVATQKARYQELFAKYQPDLICTQETPEYANVSDTVKGSTFFEDRYQYYEGNLGSLGQMYVSNKPILQTPTNVNYSVDTERYYEKTYMYFNGIKIAVFNTHLSLNAENRVTQINELITAMNQEEYVILCGDFNCATGIIEMLPFTTTGYVMANGGSLGTFNTHGTEPIDNIIVSSNITIKKVEMESTIFASMDDHSPLLAQLKIGNGGSVDVIPTIPTSNGTYTLKLTVLDGVNTFSWILDS